MSYILDALKKLENEKQKRSRRDGMVNISGELFKDEPRRASGNNGWKIVAVVLAASLVTFGATWFLLKSGRGRENAKPSTVVPAAPVIKPALPAPVPPPPVQQSDAAAPAPAPKTPAAPARKPPAAVTNPSGTSRAPTAVSSPRQGRRQKERHVKAVRSVPEERPAAASVAAPADIKVSGIAWQDERRARRAVINGFLLQEGGVVSGARITEILPDRVRFSLDNGVFEVPLTLSGFPGAGK